MHVNGESCELFISGVSQESVLGPLLFLIYDVADIPLPNGSLILYICRQYTSLSLRSACKMTIHLQQDIDHYTQSWCSKKGVNFNVFTCKCKYLVISRISCPRQPSSALRIDETLLARVAEFKYIYILKCG